MVVLQLELVNISLVKYDCWDSQGWESGGHIHLFLSYRLHTCSLQYQNRMWIVNVIEYSSLVRKTCMQVVLPLSSSTQSISQFNNAYIKYSVDLNGCRPHCCKDHSTAFISRLMTRNNLRFLSRNHFHFLCQMLLYRPH